MTDEFVTIRKKHIRMLELVKNSVNNKAIKRECDDLIKKIKDLISVHNSEYN